MSDLPRMSQFRERIKDIDKAIGDASLAELEQIARRLVTLYLGVAKPVRPSTMSRELKAMAKGLQRAARAVERLGEKGMQHLFVASHANGDPMHLDPRPHIAYFDQMSRWAARAAETASTISISQEDNKGGRTIQDNLRPLVTMLIDSYLAILAITPTHTVDPDTGLGVSLCDFFVKAALVDFAPTGVEFEPRRIDDMINWALPRREDNEFIPPPLFES